jgi:lysophospholipase L1-like esterase
MFVSLFCMRFPIYFLLAISLSAFGQAVPPESDHVADSIRNLEHYRETMIPTYMSDFGQLGRYKEDNGSLSAPRPGDKRVVFFGDSITDAWHLDHYFPGKPYINRGISGQTTSQMLVRFHQDVINLQPAGVVILAGTNDIAGNTGPISIEDIEANYASLAELARAHGIRVVFSSVTPVHNYTSQSQNFFAQRDPAKILALNAWLKNYSAANGHMYLDYFSAMVDQHGLLRKDLAEDGLHPNDAGYRIMAPLAEGAIAEALGR